MIVPRDASEIHSELEKAGRVSDYMELTELMVDTVQREESSGAHFRTEYQTEEGEAKWNHASFCCSSAWGWNNNPSSSMLNKEKLIGTLTPSVQSYK
ncbi:hypothetical protein [Winogradskyella costae]|uniref:hypothetical protein n=1 Tax=Winogradskyella costae TaxID=2697008 RepID=UPI0015CCC239|nr:hypothetical protein [Winogradskyella costae]